METKRAIQNVLLASALIAALAFASHAERVWAVEPSRGDGAEFFERRVRPLLIERCQKCHGSGRKIEGNLRVISRESILKGGDSGPAAVPGKPDESLLVKAIDYTDEPRMPPDGKLPAGEITVLKKWVALGLPWPAAQGGGSASGVRAAAAADAWTTRSEAARGWWSFQPLRRISPPDVKRPELIQNPIDRFVEARIEAAGLKTFPPAERRVLIRRATFDLTGLPPTPAEIDAFVNDRSSNAFEKVVDRLLASPAYGERWGRHWLDAVRYADYFEEKPGSHGSAAKFEIFQAFRYRDWVVRSFNGDLPYDEFLTHQIAGDLLPSPSGKYPYADGLIATSVLAIGAWDNGDGDKNKVVSDVVDDQINVVGQAFLGLTLACARCHDHKFDPVSTRDYYGLAGIFYSSHVLASVGKKGDHTVILRTPLVPKADVARREAQLKQLARLKAELDGLNQRNQANRAAAAKRPNRRFSASDRQKISTKAPTAVAQRIAGLTAEKKRLERELLPEPPITLGIAEGGIPDSLFTGIQDVPIHVRGTWMRLGEKIPRHLPVFFAGLNQPPIRKGSGRLELARWVVSSSNPLTARVLVNRVWQAHFGEGLVGTPNNFGKLGDLPTHPELLDWLASRFIDSGWSIKSLHRLIMGSAAYQRASRLPGERKLPPGEITRDADNRLLARFQPRRLEAECIRDAMLSAAGRLDLREGGPAGPDLSSTRRSLYVQTPRWSRAYYSTLFDAADPDQPIGKRNVTAVAPQALFFINHPFVRTAAEAIARRVSGAATDDGSRLDHAYRLLFARSPSAEESAVAAEFLRAEKADGGQRAWTDLVQVLLASNEFCYVD